MTPLKDCINYLLTGAQHTVFQMMKKELKIFDITPIQYGVLKCIWEYDLHNPKEIAEAVKKIIVNYLQYNNLDRI